MFLKTKIYLKEDVRKGLNIVVDDLYGAIKSNNIQGVVDKLGKK
jgi:hypothetical protein